MSSAGQVIGGVVGAVVGFFVGGPAGVVYGAQLGMMAGGLIDPAQVQGPRLEDLTSQTSTYGAFIPRVYGTAPIVGNVFWIQGDKLIERKVKSSGKGGPEVTNFEYYSTFAVSLCEGPIDGVRRIWVGGQLWYDAGSDDLSTIIAGNANAGSFTLYKGTDTQEADPLIQADRGVANVPAYRGLAYIVFSELALKDVGNSLAGAQVKVEVVASANDLSTRINEFSIAAETGWHSTLRASGNQHNRDGFSNFVAFADSYPVWVRRVGDTNITQTLSDSGQPLLEGGSLYPKSSAVQAATTSLDTLDYAFRTDSRYAVWGEGGTLDAYDMGASSSMVAFAESNGVIYLLHTIGTVHWLTKIGGSSGIGRLKTFSSRLNIYDGSGISPTLAVWGDKLVTARSPSGSYTRDLTVNIYAEIDGGLTLEDTFPVSITSISTSAFHGADNGMTVQDGVLYFVYDVTASVGSSAKVTKIDLVAKVKLETYSCPQNFGAISFNQYPSVNVLGDLVFYGQRVTTSATHCFVHNAWSLEAIEPLTVNLSDIVESECLKSELLTASDLDVTDLTDQVRGYRVSSLGPIRGGIDPLRKAWPFDAVQHGYKIKFKTRGGASVATITEAELDAREAGAEPGVQVTNVREMDTVIPDQLTIKYLDSAREYDINVAEQTR